MISAFPDTFLSQKAVCRKFYIESIANLFLYAAVVFRYQILKIRFIFRCHFGAAVPRNLLPALSQILLHPAAYTHILILHKGVHLPKHRFLAIASMGIAAPCFYQLIPFCDGMQVIHLLLSV